MSHDNNFNQVWQQKHTIPMNQPFIRMNKSNVQSNKGGSASIDINTAVRGQIWTELVNTSVDPLTNFNQKSVGTAGIANNTFKTL